MAGARGRAQEIGARARETPMPRGGGSKDAEWQGDFPEPDNERIVMNSMLDGNFKVFFSKFYLSIFFTESFGDTLRRAY